MRSRGLPYRAIFVCLNSFLLLLTIIYASYAPYDCLLDDNDTLRCANLFIFREDEKNISRKDAPMLVLYKQDKRAALLTSECGGTKQKCLECNHKLIIAHLTISLTSGSFYEALREKPALINSFYLKLRSIYRSLDDKTRSNICGSGFNEVEVSPYGKITLTLSRLQDDKDISPMNLVYSQLQSAFSKSSKKEEIKDEQKRLSKELPSAKTFLPLKTLMRAGWIKMIEFGVSLEDTDIYSFHLIPKESSLPSSSSFMEIKLHDVRRLMQTNFSTNIFSAHLEICKNGKSLEKQLDMMNLCHDDLEIQKETYRVPVILNLNIEDLHTKELIKRGLETDFQLSSHPEAYKYMLITYMYSKNPIDNVYVELMEAFEGCTLEDLLNLNNNNKFKVLNKRDIELLSLWLIDLVNFFITTLRQVRLYLRPEVILLDLHRGKPRLATAGQSIKLNEKNRHVIYEKFNCLKYWSPEYIQLTKTTTTSATKEGSKKKVCDVTMESGNSPGDIWSLGCIIHQLFTNYTHPLFRKFPSNDQREKFLVSKCLKYLEEKKISLDSPLMSNDKDLCSLMRGLLYPTPSGRWSMVQVMNSAWVKKIRKTLAGAELSNQALQAIRKLTEKKIPKPCNRIVQEVKANNMRLKTFSKTTYKATPHHLTLSLSPTCEEFRLKHFEKRHLSIFEHFREKVELDDCNTEKTCNDSNSSTLSLLPSMASFTTDGPTSKNFLLQFDLLLDKLRGSVKNLESLQNVLLQSLQMDSFGRLQLNYVKNFKISQPLREHRVKMIKKQIPFLSNHSIMILIPVSDELFNILGIMLRRASAEMVIDRSSSNSISEFAYLPKPIKTCSNSPLIWQGNYLNEDRFVHIQSQPFCIDYKKVTLLYSKNGKQLFLCEKTDISGGSSSSNLNQIVQFHPRQYIIKKPSAKQTKLFIIIKQYKLSEFRSENAEYYFATTLKIGLSLTEFAGMYPNSDCAIITYGGCCAPCLNPLGEDKGNLLIDFRWEIIEPLGCTLGELLEDSKAKTILKKNQSDRDTLAMQLIDILVLLHSYARVVHRDLCPKNVAFDLETFRLKVFDFEMSMCVRYDKFDKPLPFPEYPFHCTWGYCAPEQIAEDYYNSQSIQCTNLWESDVWAVGFMLHMIYTNHQHPLISNTKNLQRDCYKMKAVSYLNRECELLEPDNKQHSVDPSMWTLIKGMLHPRPMERWTVDQIVQSSWWQKHKNKPRTTDALSLALRKRIVALTHVQIRDRVLPLINSKYEQLIA